LDNLVAKHWNGKHELPGSDIIVYPDGALTILSCYGVHDTITKEYKVFCRPLCDTTIDSFVKYNADCWTSVTEWAIIDYKSGKIYGGECGMGNEGFIAYVDETDNLIWAIYFDRTNPIKSLKIKGNILIAINEHSELQVEINLDDLTDIKMIPAKDRFFY
jgi:hypothetical protein